MLAQVNLIPTESKQLICQAVAAIDVIKRAAKEGIIVIHPSSSTYFLIEELTGSKPKTNFWVMGAITPKAACGDMGGFTGEKQLSNIPGPGGFPFLWVIEKGKLEMGKKPLIDLLGKMGPQDVYIKGVNAIDQQGCVGIMTGNVTEGGTIGLVLDAYHRKGFNLVFPVGLEKLIPVSVRTASEEAMRTNYSYAMGIPVSLFPCSEGIKVTEVDAIKILSGALAIPIGAGGLGGAEGALTMVLKGNEEEVRKAIYHVEKAKGSKLPQLRLFNCHDCLNHMCKFPVGDKPWV